MRATLETIAGRPTLLVASTGGHLAQLVRLAPRLGVGPGSRWLTFDTEQSRSLLDGEDVHFVPYVAPRDYRGIARAVGDVAGLLNGVGAAVSTGAGLALSALPLVAARGRPTVYIESVSRFDGPSLTGKVLSRLPRVGLYTQHDSWSGGRWQVGPSVLDDFEVVDAPGAAVAPVRRIFVTLGTVRPYRFDRLVDIVRAHVLAHPGVEVRWQLGSTARDDLPGRSQVEVSDNDFSESIDWADAVVAHSGVGTAMKIMDMGKVPLLLARDPQFNEHVDSHQDQIMTYLVRRGLARDAAAALSAGPLDARQTIRRGAVP